MDMMNETMVPADAVNHPLHYTTGKYECIEFIESHGLGFHLGNAVKYITRAGLKDPKKEIEDLEKALWYLKRYILVTPVEPCGMFKCVDPINPYYYANEKCLSEELTNILSDICFSFVRSAEEQLISLIERKKKDEDR